jgi:hypothetical protein
MNRFASLIKLVPFQCLVTVLKSVKRTYNVMTWMHSNKPDSLDPTGDFKKIDQLMPLRQGQTPEDQVRDIVGAMDWTRNQEPDDKEEVPPFDKLNSIPITRRRSQEGCG